jgi:hypothetical protein
MRFCEDNHKLSRFYKMHGISDQPKAVRPSRTDFKSYAVNEVLLTVRHGTSMNQHQLDTLFLLRLLKSMPLHVSGVTRPSSAGSAQCYLV